MGGIFLSDSEEDELYVLLKPREAGLPEALKDLLRRVERSLYARLDNRGNRAAVRAFFVKSLISCCVSAIFR